MLTNETPFAAERTWTRDERGAEFRLVAIRAALEINAQARQMATEMQTNVQRAPAFEGDPLSTALLTDSDFALHKAGTDVLVVGQAHAKDGRHAAEAHVRLKVAEIDKTLAVHGERRLHKGGMGLGVTGAVPYPDVNRHANLTPHRRPNLPPLQR